MTWFEKCPKCGSENIEIIRKVDGLGQTWTGSFCRDCGEFDADWL